MEEKINAPDINKINHEAYMQASMNPPVESGVRRNTDVLTIIVFLCLIFVPAVLFWVIPDREISEDENRALQQMPTVSFKNFFSGQLMSDMDKYYADQFPFRNTFIGAKTLFSYAFGINENKGAVIAKDDYIIQRFDKYAEYSIIDRPLTDTSGNLTFIENMTNIKNNCNYINKFYDNIQNLNKDIKMTVVIPPRKIDVMTNKLPAFFPVDRNEKYYDELNRDINQDIYVDLNGGLKSHNGEYIFYKTDHHWTTLGAYYAYAALGEKLGYTPLPKESFTVETVSGSYYGTTWSKSGAKWTSPDTIEYYRTKDDNKLFVTEIRDSGNQKTFPAFYDLNALDTKDKYASFIGGINAHASVYKIADNTSPKREKLLFITDSYGQCLAPFLAQHYDLEIIDPRFYNESIYNFAKENNINNILILQNMESLSTLNNLVKLTRK